MTAPAPAPRAGGPRPGRPRPRRRWGRALLLLLLVVILVPVAAGAILYATVDPNLLKPRIAAAVERATGRTLTLAGPLGWRLSPEPMLTAADVSLANPPGASRPQMLTVQSVAIRVAWLPLLSGQVQISGLRLIRPDIRLERSAQGVPNWVFSPAARPPGAAAPAPAATPTHNASRVELRAISIRDGVVGWRQASGALVTVPVPTLDVSLTGPGVVRATGSGVAVVAGVPVRMAMQAGAGAKAGLWPVSLTLAALGAQMQATASLPAPWQVAGGRLDATATAPDLAALHAWAALPPLHDVRAQAQVTLQASGHAALDSLRVQAGASDLGGMLAGLRLASLDAVARSATGPLELVAHGSLGAVPLSVQGSVGPLPALLPGALSPAAVALSGTAGSAALALKGSIAAPRALAGKDLAFAASIPDLAAFSPSLPALKGIALHAWIGDAPGGVALHDLVLTAPVGDLEGDATIGRAGGRPVVRATLTAQRLDVDALRRAMPQPAPVAAPAAAPAPAASSAPAPPAKSAPLPPMLSARPFDLAPLRAVDADLRLTAATLRLGGADLRDVSGHLLDVGGKLAVAPFAAVLPGGPVDGTFTLDAHLPAPPVALTLHAPALAIGPTLQGLGFAPAITGAAQLDLDLNGKGASPQAIAASLAGHLGLALVDGDISNGLLEAVAGAALRSTKLPAALGRGLTRLRCVALRLRAYGGRASVRALAVDTSRVSITGDGSIDLGAETLDLHLQPRVVLGSVGAGAPVAITGPWRAPKVAEQRGADGRVALEIGGPGGGDVCGPALSVARGGQPGPVPPPRPQAHGIQPGDILRLLRHHG